MLKLPFVVEASELACCRPEEVLVIDLGKEATYRQAHVPGAIHLHYGHLVLGQPPVPGLLPPLERLAAVFGQHGVGDGRAVVAYDDEGGGRACRLLWTLDAVGLSPGSLLNGGILAWTQENQPIEADMNQVMPYSLQLESTTAALVDREFVLNHLHKPGVRLLDARSAEEFDGRKVLAMRGGHIPGARNFNWTDAMDRQHQTRLLGKNILLQRLADLEIFPNQHVITYCQTHHRSAYSYWMLKYLGFSQVSGYAGAWAEWGNTRNLPTEI